MGRVKNSPGETCEETFSPGSDKEEIFIMKRKVLSVLFATVLTAGVLAGCGSSSESSKESAAEEETLDEDTSEGQKAVDEETAAKAISEEEAEKAGFSDSAEEDSSKDSTEDAKENSTQSEESAEDNSQSESATEDSSSDTSDDFSDGSEDAAMAGTTVIDTSKQLTGTHHAEIIVKDYGKIDVELDADTAPITVTNFVKLVQDNFYDGLTFHRIIDGFMIQGGDPNGDGTGGANENIKGEFSNNGVKNDIELRAMEIVPRTWEISFRSGQRKFSVFYHAGGFYIS